MIALNHLRNKLLSRLFIFILAIGSAIHASKYVVADEALMIDVVERYKVTHVLTNLDQPWGMALLPDSRALITEKKGRLLYVDLRQAKVLFSVSGLPKIAEVGQGGLLDVVVDPDFTKNQFVYISYAAEEDHAYGTEVGRGKLVGDKLVDFKKIFVAQPKKRGGNHFGSRMVFDNAGRLFISLGDRGDRHEAQNTASHLGSIIRIYPNGDVPKDNPFVKKTIKEKTSVSDIATKELPEIYSYGHRNVQGITRHPVSGDIWAVEHGPQGGDEINRIVAGKNYGWPVITYGKEYGSGRDIGKGAKGLGTEPPMWQWTPSIAPSSLIFYSGKEFPEWQGSLLATALKYQLLSRLSYDDKKVIEEERLFEQKFGRIRNAEVDSNGIIYLLTDSKSGELLRIELNNQKHQVDRPYSLDIPSKKRQ